MASPLIVRLMRRNIQVNMDPGNMILLMGIPAFYLVFFGFGFQSIISSTTQGANSYLSFLAPGIMAFQAVTAGMVGGSMLWADKKFGMLAQLLVQPFTRLQYLLGIIFTTVIFGLAGAAIMLLGAYFLLGSLTITLYGAIGMFGIIALGSIFFGSLMLLFSALVKSNNSYTSIQILIVFVVNFASTVFYPFSNSLPLVMKALFIANPLTYVANTVRDGYMGAIPATDLYQLAILALETVLVLALAVRAYVRSGVSFE